MYAFQNPPDTKRAHLLGAVTWIPGETLQRRLMSTPPQESVALEVELNSLLEAFGLSLLSITLAEEPKSKRMITDLRAAMEEVFERALIREQATDPNTD